MTRLDARAKASGRTRYTADISLPDMVHAAAVRSTVPHGRVMRIDSAEAAALPGVLGVYTSADVSRRGYGRQVCDVPVLAGDRVRFLGERVAAVVAETREVAEAAVRQVLVEYEELPAVVSPVLALAPGAPLVHDEAWAYPGAAVRVGDGPNVQSRVSAGSRGQVDEALSHARHCLVRTYRTPAGHQGYLEPQACLASTGADGRVRVWTTNKSPYRLREQIAACLDIRSEDLQVEPGMLGGDFGGKGSPGDAPLCIELSRLVGRPVRMALRYGEDLVATDARHPATITVRVGCDEGGRLAAVALESLLDGGSYAGYKPSPAASIHGMLDVACGYRVPAVFAESTIAYTNTVPKGHMRAPGAPQATFALESALDELAATVGIDPVELRRRNLLHNGEPNPDGSVWVEARGHETLAAALEAAGTIGSGVAAGPGGEPESRAALSHGRDWVTGSGMAVYARHTLAPRVTSLRLVPLPGGRVRVEVPFPETGTGSHTVVRELLAGALALDRGAVDVAQVATDALPGDTGVSGSRVTAVLAVAASRAATAWRQRLQDGPVVVEIDGSEDPVVGSYCAQVARVAVDRATGQVRVLDLVSAVDIAHVVNPAAHQMQIDGGATMGFGFACLDDLDEVDGRVQAGSLGEFKLPTVSDLPVLRTALVPGGAGVGVAGVKAVGELANVPTAAAVANAVAAATGVRIRELPITAERVYLALQARSAERAEAAGHGVGRSR